LRVKARCLWYYSLGLLLVALGAAAAADEFDAIRQKIPDELTKRGTPSIAVAVARDGKIVWEQGFGWADRENRVPANEHTMYSLASISKPITATGLAVLIERGKIELDKPINDYLGEAKLIARVGNPAEATVRRVANHSSGLPLHYQFFYADEPYRRPAMYETIRRYGNLVTAPGERFQYSNLGYGVIDYVISRAAGKPFADFMREEVFLPLGLTHMSVDIGPGLEKYEAVRYGTDGLRIPFYDFDHPGGSAIYASAHDLVRFGMFHLGDRQPDQKEIISDSLRRQMQEPTAESGKSQGYGIGWLVDKNSQGETIVSHSGGMGGVNTLLTLVPGKRLAVAVLANSNSGLPFSISKEILEVVMPTTAESEEKENGNLRFQAPSADAEVELQSLAGTWKGHVHTYERDLPITISVHKDGDVHVQIEGQLETLLNRPRFRDGWLRGRMSGDLQTSDTARTPYDLQLEVKQRDNVLAGSLIAMSRPGKRAGNALTHWIELCKEPEKE
jgi:CubicO group peptidase (beta-lactamase class C family)